MKGLIDAEYGFKDKDEARAFFTRLIGLYKNFNYSAAGTPEYSRYRQEIEELAAKVRMGK